jgi:hypothetical protein
MADGTLKVGTITTSSGSGNINIGSGVTLVNNTPALSVYLSANSTGHSDGTRVTVPFDTVDSYTASGTWDSTNYRWTPGVAGKYYFTSSISSYPDGNTGKQMIIYLHKNGTELAWTYLNMNSTATLRSSGYNALNLQYIDVASATDYYDIRCLFDTNGVTFTIGGKDGSSDNKRSWFQAHRLGI